MPRMLLSRDRTDHLQDLRGIMPRNDPQAALAYVSWESPAGGPQG